MNLGLADSLYHIAFDPFDKGGMLARKKGKGAHEGLVEEILIVFIRDFKTMNCPLFPAVEFTP